MASGHAATRSQLYTDLYDALAGHRHAEHARAMTDALLRADTDARRLVGVGTAFDRALFYDRTTDRLVARAFDKHGLVAPDDGGADDVARGVADPGEWVATSSDSFGWIHPRYR